ncbi:MAG: cadherin domain-containing protein [Chloroflexota bacterium]|nr:cadherin domain-containing protein [Chloroflexota bacterium]MDE2941583.1 cadherin domain-containing protein [Chloroflexota bacterium]
MKRSLKLAVVTGLVAALGLLGLMQVAAQQSGPTVTREISPASVPATGGEVTVTITIAGSYQGIGSVTETIPAGFSYVSGSGSITPTESGQELSFTLLGETSLSYKVMAPATPGQHQFDGELSYGLSRTKVSVAGHTSVTVEPAGQPTGVTVTRSISPASIAAGDETTVTIAITGSYTIGAVVETLPTGFSYVSGSGSITPTESGQELSFALLGETSLSYKIMADATVAAGQHAVSGELRYGIQQPRSVVAVTGDSSVTVAATTAVTVTRGINPASVAAGEQATVTVTIAGDYSIGSVTETLPAGFSYVPGSVRPSAVAATVSGQDVSFALLGETPISYSVTASATAGQYAFSGQLVYGVSKTSVAVGGDADVTVTGQTGVAAIRAFNPSSLQTGGGETTVTITIAGAYGGIGTVAETLPAGFSYISGSGSITPTENGQTLNFALLGESSVSYRVTTTAADGTYPFTGSLTYSVDRLTVAVTGAPSILVGAAPPPSPEPPPPPPPPVPSPEPGPPPANQRPIFDEGITQTRSIAEESEAGASVGEPVVATDANGDDITYRFQSGDVAVFDIDGSTGQITVAEGANLDFETRDSYSVVVRAEDHLGAADIATVTINVTDVDEAPPTVEPTEEPTPAPTVAPTPRPTAVPTAMPEPTAVPTATPAPTATTAPTATAAPTAVPTATPEPTEAPTAMPEPTMAPEPTAMPEPTATPEPTMAPPTATTAPTAAPTATSAPEPEEEAGFPVVIIILIIVILAVVIGGFLFLRSRGAG